MRDDASAGTPPERPRAGLNRRDALRLAAVGAAAGLAAPRVARVGPAGAEAGEARHRRRRGDRRALLRLRVDGARPRRHRARGRGPPRRARQDDPRPAPGRALRRRRGRALHPARVRPILEVRREVRAPRRPLPAPDRDVPADRRRLVHRGAAPGPEGPPRFGFNAREVDFIARRGWTELPLLYLGPYLDAIGDEYQPFGVGLDQLDEIAAGELLAKDGASDAAIRFNGLRRGDGTPAARNGEVSALFRVWQAAIVKRRGLPVFKREVFRLKGGNQLMTDTFAAKLGGRVRLGCPITSIERGDSSVTVHFREFGEPATLEADYLVCSIPLAILKTIPVKPAWPEAKEFVIRNVVFGSQARVVLQSRTKFWKGDVPSINLETGDPAMYLVYQTADEVPGSRGVLMGSGRADVTADEALAAFRRFYPGKRQTVEQAIVHNWAKDPWAFGCERMPFPLGQLKKFWPQIMEPVGRVHFAGSFADNLPWGMDAATRSANRVAAAIDAL